MKPTLMIADDDSELCDVYDRFLTRHGYNVVTAANGMDCVEKVRRFGPDVLVLDQELLWGGGDGVLAWLREGGATRPVAVVLTATASQPSEDDLGPPVVGFLPKPFTLATLLERVRVAQQGLAAPDAADGETYHPELFIG